MRTPPFQAVLSSIDDQAAIPLLVEDLLVAYPDLSGVLARTDDARWFAELWRKQAGSTTRLKTSERIFRCTKVDPPRPVSGRLRGATRADRDTVAVWLGAFALEALGETADAAQTRTMADRWLEARERRLFLWEDDARPVSLVGVSGETPNGIRVAPVYTPPELRGRGYASACVAAVTQAQFDRGRRFCFLFTDLANPTSNKIYQAIGYEPVCDVDEYRFEARPAH